jgi:hypothetical protein
MNYDLADLGMEVRDLIKEAIYPSRVTQLFKNVTEIGYFTILQ